MAGPTWQQILTILSNITKNALLVSKIHTLLSRTAALSKQKADFIAINEYNPLL